jgi:predicted O-methyltransferase YrrM
VEVGVFTGSSALRIALALPPEGYLLACDVRPDFTEIGIPYWEEAGVRGKIDLVHAPAADTLRDRIEAGEGGGYDFAFIDADKENYPRYYELCLNLLKPGGLMCVDNVLWSGRVVDPSDTTLNTEAVRKLNRIIRDDHRVEQAVIPVADGVTLVRKL